ncbi:DMT family transporter [Sediminitomix flava]|uniref:Drug/metabolite transporter (DMT)-like permease n=1 Tax=Sediminitomix flava TaxID=379075 RepID=A0A315Z9G9_SEDFL|nr:DMT family transporter [Sediminitomix flava]PWJ41069.1 drug/metabolite transporter (DMT)-like permease [Sediminitomix flava]
MEKQSRFNLPLEAGLALISFSLTPIFIKGVSANSVTIGVIRLGFAVLLTYLFLVKKNELKSLNKKDIYALVGMGLLFGVHWLTYFLSIKIGTAVMAFMGLCTYGIWLTFLGWIFGLRKPTGLDLLSLVVVTVGSLIAVPEFSFENEETLGLGIAIFSALFFAGLPILQQQNTHISSGVRALGQYTFAIPIFAFGLFFMEWNAVWEDWYYFLVLIAVCTFLAHTLWLRVTTHVPTTVSSILYYLSMPATMMFSYLILSEAITFEKVTGALLIILANVMKFLPELRKRKRMSKTESVQ